MILRPELVVIPSLFAACAVLTLAVSSRSEEAIRERGRFVVALSGGSLPGIVFPQLRAAGEFVFAVALLTPCELWLSLR